MNVIFVVGKLRREIDQLPGKHPARRAVAAKIIATTSSTAAIRPIQRSILVTSGESRKVSSAASASGIKKSRAK